MSSKVFRILFISSEFPPGPGGIGNHAFHLVEELRKNGCEVVVISPQEFAALDEIRLFNQDQQFSVRSIDQTLRGFKKAWCWLREIISATHKYKPGLIIGSGARAVWLSAIAARFRKIPLLAIGHGSEFGGPITLERKITRWAFNQADSVIYVSRFTQNAARDLGIHPPREYVIHNGADANLFCQPTPNAKIDWARSLVFSESDPILLTVGNLTRRKGQEIVIRALTDLLLDFPNLRYLMAGLPTEKIMLQSLARELGVLSNVYFLGNVNRTELPSLYQACDIFVMTSQRMSDGDFEGFGISVIEAALCSKPAVVSGDSGLAEAVIDGVTGICVPEKDPTNTALAIKRLLLDFDIQNTMGEKAKERALAELTWEKVGAEYWRVIQPIIGA